MSGLLLGAPREPWGLALGLTIRGSTAAWRQMSALDVAWALGVKLDCRRPISPRSIVRAKGTFSATASHTSVRWLTKDRRRGLWVSPLGPWQVRAPVDPRPPPE